jgi:aminopeptidase N
LFITLLTIFAKKPIIMKNIYLFIAIFFALSAKAQENREFEQMVESEMKSASRTINLAVNPNTANYDITYHKLEFTVDPAVASISGKVTTTYTATANMSTVTFELYDSLTVSSVKMNGVDLFYSQPGTNEVVITLASMQMMGTSRTVEIVYAGDPPQGQGFGSFTTDFHNNIPVMWTLSEPFGARDWWPCKQDLNDKIDSIDVYITAPSQYISVSNGVEPEAPVVNGALKTTHFRHLYPIPAYLIAIAVTDYQVYNQQGGLGTPTSPFFPIVNYMYPETATANIASLSTTPSIINFFETKFGAYPFRNEKYGHCQFGWGGGMEHTTVSFMTANASGAYARSLIAHEMGHQWFGDKITCGTWKDIWLNEGITEYLSGLVVEHLDGNTAFRTWKTGKITSVTNIAAPPSTSNLYLTDVQATSVGRIFSSTVTYNKGSMVTHMLRNKLGDALFFQAMNTYINNPQFTYKYAVTTDFKTQMETVTGLNLTEFFNDWVYGQGYPSYTISVQNLVGNQAKIIVNQTQVNSTVSFFEMPLEIKVNGAAGATQTLRVDNTTNGQEFIVPTNFLISSVSFDPEKNVVSKSNVITLNPVLGTLANNSFELEKAILLSPNPASTVLNIETPSNVIFENASIYNLLGQKVLDSNTNNVSVSGLSNGIYAISIKTSEGLVSKKFVKN